MHSENLSLYFEFSQRNPVVTITGSLWYPGRVVLTVRLPSLCMKVTVLTLM